MSNSKPIPRYTGLSRTAPLNPGTSQLRRSASIGRSAIRNTASRDGIFPAAGSAVSGPARNAARTSSSGKLTPPEPSEFTSSDLPDYLTAYARARVEIRPDGCWHWTGPVNPKGYGVANLPGGKREGAHQHVFRLSGGQVAADMTLDHQCHNRDLSCAGGRTCLHRRCVNPAHMEEATRGDNARRGKTTPALNLAKKKCPKGHEYDYADSRGWRKCSKCVRANQNSSRRAKNTARRKPCRRCSGPVEASRYRYCAECRKKRAAIAAEKGGARVLHPLGFSARVRVRVRKRAGRGDVHESLCESCGAWLGGAGGEFQHRVARGAGGCRDEVINGPANCSLLCHKCHLRAESRDPHMGMDAAGFWVKHGTTPEFDPRNVPIMLHGNGGGGLTLWLAADGLGLDGTGYLLSSPLAVTS